MALLGPNVKQGCICELIAYLSCMKAHFPLRYICVGQEPYPKVDHTLLASALSYDSSSATEVPASVQCFSQMLSSRVPGEEHRNASYRQRTMMIESVLRCSYSLAHAGMMMVNIVPVRYNCGCALRERLKSEMSGFIARVCAIFTVDRKSPVVIALGHEAHESLDRGFRSIPSSHERPRVLSTTNPVGVSYALPYDSVECLGSTGYRRRFSFESLCWRHAIFTADLDSD